MELIVNRPVFNPELSGKAIKVTHTYLGGSGHVRNAAHKSIPEGNYIVVAVSRSGDALELTSNERLAIGFVTDKYIGIKVWEDN